MRKADITADLVSRLIADQFPQWAGLPIQPVEAGGVDNTTFRLGQAMSVRLPSADAYVEQVDKEQRWLPVLAGSCPCPFPNRLRKGYRVTASPGPGLYTGGSTAIPPPPRGSRTWRSSPPTWPTSSSRCTRSTRPAARVIDFGTCGVGDPACDTTIAWTFRSGEGSRVFRERLPFDEATWARGRGWAIWKAMIVLVEALEDDPDDTAYTKAVIEAILADHVAAG